MIYVCFLEGVPLNDTWVSCCLLRLLLLLESQLRSVGRMISDNDVQVVHSVPDKDIIFGPRPNLCWAEDTLYGSILVSSPLI